MKFSGQPRHKSSLKKNPRYPVPEIKVAKKKHSFSFGMMGMPRPKDSDDEPPKTKKLEPIPEEENKE